jgi:hypothetical protein
MSTRYNEIDIPIGLRGIFGTSETFALGAEEYLLGCDNITFIDGVVASDFGEEDYNSTAISSPILGGTEFNHDQQTPVVVVFTQDGRLLRDNGDGNFSITLASGLNASNHPVFVSGGKEGAALNRKLFIFTGTNQVKVLSGNGTSVSNISNPPVDWSTNYPKSGFIFEGRLCGFGNRNDPHRLYFSTTTNHEDFIGAGSFTLSIFPGEGEGLSAAIPVQYGVVLFKYPRGVYFLDASDPVTTNWRIYKVSSAVGTPSQKSVVDIGEAIFFIDSSGSPYLMQLGGSNAIVGSSGFISLLNLANRHAIMSFILRKLDKTLIKDKWFAFYDPRTSEFGFSDTNTSIKVDLLTGQPRFREIRNPKANCSFEILGVNSNVRTIAFGAGGKVLKGVLDKYKTPVEFLTSGYDFYREGIAGKRKIAGELEVRLTFFKGVPEDVDVEVFLDDKPSNKKTIHFSGAGLSIYGTTSNPGTGAYYDAGFQYYLGGEFRSTRKTETIKLFGTGRFIRVAVKQKGEYGVSPAGVAVNRLVLRTMAGDERV